METNTVSVLSENKTKEEETERTYSNESFYTDSSEGFRSKCKSAANLLQKRRQLHPLLNTGSPYRSASNYGPRFITLNSPTKLKMNGYAERIMSAKLIRVKQLQSELTEAQFHLNELSTENKLLKTLQKRQDRALSRYESTKAELPKLIQSHNEEVRILKLKVKQLRAQCREKDHRIKELDGDLQNLRDQHRHLLKLSKDHQLKDREQLTKEVEDLKETISEQDIKIQTLNRKIMLETKNFKHQLSNEISRQKETQKNLLEAVDKIAKLELSIEEKERYIANFGPKRFDRKSNKKSTTSLTTFCGQLRFPELNNTGKSEADIIQRVEELLSEEESFMASHTTTNNSTIPNVDNAEIIQYMPEHILSDGYNERRMKLANKRKTLLESKILKIIPTNSEHTSSDHSISTSNSSSTIADDNGDEERMDNKPPFSFGTHNSRKSSLNSENIRDLSSLEKEEEHNFIVSEKEIETEESCKSQSRESLQDEHNADTFTRTSRRSSLQEVEKKDLLKTITYSNLQKENTRRRNSFNKELRYLEKSLKKEASDIKCISRRGSIKNRDLIMNDERSTEEESLPKITSKNSSRRASLKDKKFNNENSKGSDSELDQKECTSDEEAINETAEVLTNISETYARIQETINTDTEKIETKLQRHFNETDTFVKENEIYKKEKLLAALKAIDDGKDPVIDTDKNLSIFDSIVNASNNNSESPSIALPFLGKMKFSEPDWRNRRIPKDRSPERIKTRDELMQELCGSTSFEH